MAGTQVDVWSLGCMIYELLSGHKLFGGEAGSRGQPTPPDALTATPP